MVIMWRFHARFWINMTEGIPRWMFRTIPPGIKVALRGHDVVRSHKHVLDLYGTLGQFSGQTAHVRLLHQRV